MCAGGPNPDEDGGTIDKSPGIGVEFETGHIRFFSSNCDKASTDALKGKMVGNRHGDNWMLTADTTLNDAGLLDAEYILDGRNIKLGTGAAEQAADEVRRDVVRIHPPFDENHRNYLFNVSLRFHGIHQPMHPIHPSRLIIAIVVGI